MLPVIPQSRPPRRAPSTVSLSAAPLGLLRLALLLLFAPLIATLGACSDCGGGNVPDGPPVQQLYPEVQLSVAALTFDPIRVGEEVSREIIIGNSGRVSLEIGRVAVDDDAQGAFIVALDQSIISAGGTATLTVTYVPKEEGPSEGNLSIATNDPDAAVVLIPLAGEGTVSDIFVNPRLLTFTEIEAGQTSQAQVVEITNEGSGFLEIQSIELTDEAKDAFAIAVPSSFEPGFLLDAGLTLPVRVTYKPPADAEANSHTGFLRIVSDSANENIVEVTLAGTSEATAVDLPPEIIIFDPDPKGTAFFGQPMYFEAEVYGDGVPDEESEEDIKRVFVNWFSSIDGPIGSSIPDPFLDEEDPNGIANEGLVTFITTRLSVGNHVITAFATDASGKVGMAQVEVEIWNEESELNYVIAGVSSSSGFESSSNRFTVDDNLEIFRTDPDGSNPKPCVILRDDIINENHPPVPCNAKIGDQIHIIAYDRYASGAAMHGLTLHFGEEHQRLVDPVAKFPTGEGQAVCSSSPYKRDWYDENDTPYTGDCEYLNVTVTVAIPLIPEPEEG